MNKTILQEHMLQIAKTKPPDYFFQHNNNPKHDSHLVRNSPKSIIVPLRGWLLWHWIRLPLNICGKIKSFDLGSKITLIPRSCGVDYNFLGKNYQININNCCLRYFNNVLKHVEITLIISIVSQFFLWNCMRPDTFAQSKQYFQCNLSFY